MVDLVLGLAVVAGLFAYLVVALMRPDRFDGGAPMSPFCVFALYGAVTVGLAWMLAGHMHRVFTGRRVWSSR